MYCKSCPRKKGCVELCKSLKTFLSRQENLHHGLLVDDSLLNFLHQESEKRKEKSKMSENKLFRGVRVRELSKTIRALLCSFTPEERRMLLLRFKMNWPFHEIANELKLSHRQRAHYRMNQLLKELRSYLKTIYGL